MSGMGAIHRDELHYKRTFKKDLGLFTETRKYNLLAQLISDDSHIPIRFAIFNGTNKASTRVENAVICQCHTHM